MRYTERMPDERTEQPHIDSLPEAPRPLVGEPAAVSLPEEVREASPDPLDGQGIASPGESAVSDVAPAEESPPVATASGPSAPVVVPEPVRSESASAARTTTQTPRWGPYELAEARARALAARQRRMQKLLDTIMAYVGTKGSVSNDDVEAALHVGDRSATKYLGVLLKEGLLKRVGMGRATRYEVDRK